MIIYVCVCVCPCKLTHRINHDNVLYYTIQYNNIYYNLSYTYFTTS